MSTNVRIVCQHCSTEHPTFDAAVRCCGGTRGRIDWASVAAACARLDQRPHAALEGRALALADAILGAES